MFRLHPIPTILFLFFFFQTPIFGKIIYVNATVQGGNANGTSWEDAYSNLSFGLFFASYGDTVWVAQGTYFPTGGTNRNLSFTLKNGVKLFGGFDGTEAFLAKRDWEANETILSGDIGEIGDSTDNSYSVVYCDEADSTTELNGFIITGGNADEDSFGVPSLKQKSGGGMYIVGSSTTEDTRPVIRNCQFISNHAIFYGGGIFVYTNSGASGNPIIFDCEFNNNTAFNGGGVYWEGGSQLNDLILRQCVFDGNSTSGFGGGLSAVINYGNKKLEIFQCIFKNNSVISDGGAIHYDLQINDQELQIRECEFINNSTFNNAGPVGIGGAIQIYFNAASDHLVVDKCIFSKNKSDAGIIGIFGAFVEGMLRISNSVFDDNQDFCFNLFDGSLVVYNSLIKGCPIGNIENTAYGNAEFSNCTFVDNLKNNNALFSITGTNVPSTLDFRNCISHGNFDSNKYLVSNSSIITEVTISNSLVDFPDCSSLYNSPAGNNISCGPGMLYQQDPLFADTAAGNFNLLPLSPAINAGSNDVISNLGITNDLAGNPRIICGTVDMGAYEFISSGGNVSYVNGNVQGGIQDGSSWNNAYSNLQDALVNACYGDIIWVAKGTYFPTTETDRNTSFEIPSGVKLYGGFDGTETLITERDWEANETILSGDIGLIGDDSDNSYTVVYMEYVDSNTVLDGFQIVDSRTIDELGQAPILDRSKSGGGLYIQANEASEKVNPKILNCTFKNNYAFNRGGGAFVNGDENEMVSPYFFNCQFIENAAGWGGGLAITGSSDAADWVIRECHFIENFGGIGGGIHLAFKNGEFNVLIEQCNFLNGNAGASGSGIHFEDLNNSFEKIISLEGSTFKGNGGGSCIEYISYSDVGEIIIDQCSFTDNLDPLVIFGGQQVRLSNSIFHQNNSSFTCLFFYGGLVNIYNCVFSDNSGTLLTFIEESLALDVLIANSTFYNNRLALPNLYDGLISTDGIGIGGQIDIFNSIFENNDINANSKLFKIENSLATIQNSLLDVQDCSGIEMNNLTCGPGMLYGSEPLFVNSSDNDFRLLPCSPAINSGNNAIINNLGIFTDLSGNPRILGDTVDMGAFEHVKLPYIANITEVQPPACHGETGSFSVSMSGGCGPYSVQFVGASTVEDSTSFTITGLPAGNFEFTITDLQGQTDTIQVEIPGPTVIQLEVLTTPIDCVTGTLGSAIAEASGGTGELLLYWFDDSNGDTIEWLEAGIYDLIVTDSLGCNEVITFQINREGELLVDPIATSATCFDATDGAAAAVSSGLAPFSWLWEGGQTDSLLTGLAPGEYLLTVTDALGCTGSVDVIVGSTSSIMVEIAGADTLCYGSMDGELAAVPTGGVPPYNYDWLNGVTDSLLTGIGAGNYPHIVTDSLGCTTNLAFTLFEFPQITIMENVTHATSPTNSDGQIEISDVAGGKPNYSFLWSNGVTDQSISNLPTGDYSLTITDGAGCQEVFNFFVDFMDAVGEKEVESIHALIVPNPSGSNGAALWLDVPYSLEIDLQVFDGLGRQVFEKNEFVFSEHAILSLPTGLPAGVYWVVLKNEESNMVALKWVVL